MHRPLHCYNFVVLAQHDTILYYYTDEVDLTLVPEGHPDPSDPVIVAKLENKHSGDGVTLVLVLGKDNTAQLKALSEVSVFHCYTSYVIRVFTIHYHETRIP